MLLLGHFSTRLRSKRSWVTTLYLVNPINLMNAALRNIQIPFTLKVINCHKAQTWKFMLLAIMMMALLRSKDKDAPTFHMIQSNISSEFRKKFDAHTTGVYVENIDFQLISFFQVMFYLIFLFICLLTHQKIEHSSLLFILFRSADSFSPVFDLVLQFSIKTGFPPLLFYVRHR